MKKKIGNFAKQFGKGLLKEAVSYIPIFGDNLANAVENKLGTGVSVKDPQIDRMAELAGKALPWIGGIVVALMVQQGWISMDVFTEAKESIENK